MRFRTSVVAAAVAVVVVAVAACSDVGAPPSGLAPTGPSFTAAPKVTICHAAGRAGTTHYIQLTISANGLAGHFNNNGTPKAGHELDTMGPCTVPTGTVSVCVVNGTLFGQNLGQVSFSGDLGAFGPVTIPAPGAAPACTDFVVSAGDYDVTQSGPSDIWVETVNGGTVTTNNIGSVLYAGQQVNATVTAVDGTTTTMTFVEQR